MKLRHCYTRQSPGRSCARYIHNAEKPTVRPSICSSRATERHSLFCIPVCSGAFLIGVTLITPAVRRYFVSPVARAASLPICRTTRVSLGGRRGAVSVGSSAASYVTTANVNWNRTAVTFAVRPNDQAVKLGVLRGRYGVDVARSNRLRVRRCSLVGTGSGIWLYLSVGNDCPSAAWKLAPELRQSRDRT